MADTSLPDLLSGVVGAPVNRPQLNAFIARSQAQNGLTSAQTQDAMIKAQQGQEELDAHAKVDDALADMYPDMKPSERTLSKAALIGALGGSSETAVKALGLLKAGNGNPQQQVSGFQQYTGEPVKPLAVPNTYEQPVAPPGGSAYGPPQQTVEGAAHTAAETANANLHQNQSDNPSLFHPGGQQTKIDPVQARYCILSTDLRDALWRLLHGAERGATWRCYGCLVVVRHSYGTCYFTLVLLLT